MKAHICIYFHLPKSWLHLLSLPTCKSFTYVSLHPLKPQSLTCPAQLGDSSASSSETDLPYPQPLTRASFLTPNFSPTSFLSSLHNRHQTLEDLRTELRTRSQELKKELLDLVNENYQDFLLLGSSLQGGEEKVEEVRVGLLAFKRDVEGLRKNVEVRRKEVEGLLEEKRRVGEQVQLGRRLLEVKGKIMELEIRLTVPGGEGNQDKQQDDGETLSSSEDEDDEPSDDGNHVSQVPTSRLKMHAQRYIYIQKLVSRIGTQHPFLVKQQERIIHLRQTVLLDLSNALKNSAFTNDGDKGRLMRILAIYRDMGEAEEALKILREKKS